MLDAQSQAMLDEIATKEVAALTPEDIGFLRARKFYLNSDQHNRYAEVLGSESGQATPEVTSEATEQDTSADGTPAENTSPRVRGRRRASVTE